MEDMSDSDILDDWKKKLFEFTTSHHRAVTPPEWRWLRYQYEVENFKCAEEDYRLAADGETVNASLVEGGRTTHVARFVTPSGGTIVTITLRPQGGEKTSVHIRMLSREGHPIVGGHIRFPEIEHDIVTDAHGRAKMEYDVYLSYLQNVLGLRCLQPGGGEEPLELE